MKKAAPTRSQVFTVVPLLSSRSCVQPAATNRRSGMMNSGPKYRRKSVNFPWITPTSGPVDDMVDDKNGDAQAASPLFWTGLKADPVKNQSLSDHRGDARTTTIRPVALRIEMAPSCSFPKSARSNRKIDAVAKISKSRLELAIVSGVYEYGK